MEPTVLMRPVKAGYVIAETHAMHLVHLLKEVKNAEVPYEHAAVTIGEIPGSHIEVLYGIDLRERKTNAPKLLTLIGFGRLRQLILFVRLADSGDVIAIPESHAESAMDSVQKMTVHHQLLWQ